MGVPAFGRNEQLFSAACFEYSMQVRRLPGQPWQHSQQRTAGPNQRLTHEPGGLAGRRAEISDWS
jgi:hypothetical protein